MSKDTYKATTPTITLTFSDESLDLTLAQEVIVTMSDIMNNPVLEVDDPTVTANTISFELTQAQTLALPDIVFIQANWTYLGGKRACSNIRRMDLNDNLHNEVMA